MKVTLGPYRDWWGPYQIADKIPFISEDTADKRSEEQTSELQSHHELVLRLPRGNKHKAQMRH